MATRRTKTLRERIEDAGLSSTEVARLLRAQESAVRQWLAGVREPPAHRVGPVPHLAEVLELSPKTVRDAIAETMRQARERRGE